MIINYQLSSGQMTKTQWRRQLLKSRQSIPVMEWQEKSLQLCHHIQSSSLFTSSRTILAYFSFRQEPDLSSLFATNHQWGFPRCVDKSLVWHRWQPGDDLEKNAYGIWEPRRDAPEIVATEVDLILVPAVACDSLGYRLGYGGGFYDRMLSQPEWAHISTVGIVFASAFLPSLPNEPWDQRLTWVGTENGLFLATR